MGTSAWSDVVEFNTKAGVSIPLEKAKMITNDDYDYSDRYNHGRNIAISDDGNYVVIGNCGATIDENYSQGAAYVFTKIDDIWTQQTKLIASDGIYNHGFGYSVDIINDGSYIAIGSPYAGENNEGAVYFFTRIGTNWTEEYKLSPDPELGEYSFGSSISMTPDGNNIVVGSHYGGDYGSGSAYVFTKSGTSWSQSVKLTASDGAVSDQFGYSVAITDNGGYIIVGSAYEENTSIGSAYIFVKEENTWTQQARLIASDGLDYDNFGMSVDISSDGSYAVIGARNESKGCGAAYILNRIDDTWTQEIKLVDEDTIPVFNLHDGQAVLSGDGNYGLYPSNKNSCYVYAKVDNEWIKQAELSSTGYYDHRLISHDGSYAVIADISAVIDGVEYQGAVYVYSRSGSTWTQQAKIIASDGAYGDEFGKGLVVSADFSEIIIGSPDAKIGSKYYQGAVYVYSRSGSTWTQKAKLVASDGAQNDGFGYSIDILNDDTYLAIHCGMNNSKTYIYINIEGTWTQQTVLVDNGIKYGASYISPDVDFIVGRRIASGSWTGGNNIGYVAIFTRSGSTWSVEAILTSDPSDFKDYFGLDIVISDDRNTIIVTAINADISGNTDQGAVYIFVKSEGTWSQQAKLIDVNGAANDQFGRTILTSTDCNYLTIVSRYDNSKIFIFNRSEGLWTQQIEIADGYTFQDFWMNDDASVFIYSSYTTFNTVNIYTRSGDIWSKYAELIPSDQIEGVVNGTYLSNIKIVSTNPFSIIFTSLQVNLPKVYKFTETENGWDEEITALGAFTYPDFGWSVSMSSNGNYVVIGAPEERLGIYDYGFNHGAVHTYVRVNGIWTKQAKLLASDTQFSEHGEQFGYCVSMTSNGSSIAIGSFTENEGGGFAAYIFD